MEKETQTTHLHCYSWSFIRGQCQKFPQNTFHKIVKFPQNSEKSFPLDNERSQVVCQLHLLQQVLFTVLRERTFHLQFCMLILSGSNYNYFAG